jgi:hypothetical protein
MFVKPREGVRVIRPDTMRPLPPEGAEVAEGPHDFHWFRIRAQGDLEPEEAPAQPEPISKE